MSKENWKNPRLLSIIIVVMLSCMLAALPLLAAGQGDGSGGGKDIALGLDSSFPADGQKNVTVTGDIKLTFNKNVIFLGIREANKTCFSLIASDGKQIPIEVIMADDQTTEGFEKRRDISVRPVQKLQPGTGYVVKVSPKLQAKNGSSLGHEVMVSFITAGVAPQTVESARVDSEKKQTEIKPTASPPLENLATPSSDSVPVLAQTAQSVEQSSQNPEEKVAAQTAKTPSAEIKTPATTVKVPEDQKTDKATEDKQVQANSKLPASAPEKSNPGSNLILAAVAGVILVAGSGLYYSKRRK